MIRSNTIQRLLLTALALASMLGGLLISEDASAQAQIQTRKEKIGDFTIKTMKVVLSGNKFNDAALSDAIRNSWSISPYEVCTQEEFEKLMTDSKYYFMVQDLDKEKPDDPGIWLLRVVKGTQGAKKIKDMYEVASFPLCGGDGATGREDAFIPAFLDIIQSHIENSMLSGGNAIPTSSLRKVTMQDIYFVPEDLCPEVQTSYVEGLARKRVLLTDISEQLEIVLNGTLPSLVSYVVAPLSPTKHSVCYLLLIDARTHELYYFKKEKVGGAGRGYRKGNIRDVISHR